MRTLPKWALALVVPIVCVALVWSQERMFPEGTTIKLLLLRQKSVQKELEISEALAKKIMTFTTAQSHAAAAAFKLEEDKRKTAFEKLSGLNKKFLADSLTEKQGKRLDQITLQFTALHQLTRPEAAKTLDLTEEQQQKFKALHTASHKEMAEILSSKDADERTAKFAKYREKNRASILAVLTEKQLAQVRELAGPPFLGEIVFEDHKADEK